MALPDVISIDGIDYIRDDVARERYRDLSAPPESWHGAYELAREFRIDVHRIYDAIRDGTLPARRPHGVTRGWKIRRADFIAWMDTWEVAS